MNEASPQPPWALAGTAVAGIVRRRGRLLGRCPEGLAPAPGPGVVVGVWYQVSPIGPFCELDVLEPVRFGARPGWSVTRSVVSDGRAGWGVAREVGRVQWAEDAGEVSVVWVERGLKMTARRRPGSWPVVVRSRLLQGGGTVPVRLRALAHRARVEIDVEEGEDGLGVLAGGHPGVVLSSQRLRVRPALQRAGTIRSLWAAVPPAEPGAAGIGMTSVH